MNNNLANGILKLSGYITGIHPHKWLDFMCDAQWWDAQTIRDWQKNQLIEILSHAVSTVPYYQQTFSPLDNGQIANPFEYLSKCPVLTKDHVRENFSGLLSVDPSVRRTLDNSTSGSTGKPLHLRVDRPGFARYFAAKMRALGWYDVRFSDRQLRIWGLSSGRNQQAYWRVRDKLQNRLRLVSFDLSDEMLEKYFKTVLRFQPTYINGYTSAIFRFAQYINMNKLNGRAFNTRVVVPTAEILLDKQKEEMEEAFGCPVMNEYGCGEIQAIAYKCPDQVFHITHENVFIEVLDEAGKPVPSGQRGLLTITSFCNKAMPLIRYQNGDLVTMESNHRCVCGRHEGLPVFRSISGRSSDVLFRTDGEPTHWTVIYYAIKAAFKSGMVVEHQARQYDYDFIEISVVKGPAYQQSAMNDFLVLLRESLGQDLRIDLCFVEKIEREESGKFRYFLSEIPKARLRES